MAKKRSIKVISQSRYRYRETPSFCSLGRIGKQEVLPVNDKGLNTSLCPVIAQFQSAIF